MYKYKKIIQIGEGTYGTVFKARDTENNRFVALKQIRLEKEEEGIPCTAIREISLLRELHHPNIVGLFDVIHSEKLLTIVFEYLDAGDLKIVMNSKKKENNNNLNNNDINTVNNNNNDNNDDNNQNQNQKKKGILHPKQIKSFLYQTLLAIEYCHSHSIIHRDLKPQNLFINKNGELKLGDFGLARSFGIPIKKQTSEVVTLWYRPPEVLLGSTSYDTSIDIWSIGCIFAEMIDSNHSPIFGGSSNETEQFSKIVNILGSPSFKCCSKMIQLPNFAKYFEPFLKKNINNDINQKNDIESILSNYQFKKPNDLEKKYSNFQDKNGIDLLKRMLEYDPKKRITAKKALSHSYFK